MNQTASKSNRLPLQEIRQITTDFRRNSVVIGCRNTLCRKISLFRRNFRQKHYFDGNSDEKGFVGIDFQAQQSPSEIFDGIVSVGDCRRICRCRKIPYDERIPSKIPSEKCFRRKRPFFLQIVFRWQFLTEFRRKHYFWRKTGSFQGIFFRRKSALF